MNLCGLKINFPSEKYDAEFVTSSVNSVVFSSLMIQSALMESD
jgi:hypothetical protein